MARCTATRNGHQCKKDTSHIGKEWHMSEKISRMPSGTVVFAWPVSEQEIQVELTKQSDPDLGAPASK